MFYDEFMKFAAGFESPTAFFKWSSFAIISAVLRDNIYCIQGGYKRLYPNIYVLLLANSAVDRKGHGVQLAGDLVGKIANTKVIIGRTSIQAVIEKMAKVEMNTTTGVHLKGGSVFLCADELAAFLVADPQSIPILTDIYDAREEYKSNLKNSGESVIKNICVTLLAASNETFLKEVYSKTAIYGGLVGRTFFVKPDEERPPNSLFRGSFLSMDPVINSLKELVRLKGEAKFSEAAIDEYEKWYFSLKKSKIYREDKTGVYGRIHTGVVKLAMLIGVGTTHHLNIEKEHVEQAIFECISLVPNYEGFVMATGKSEQAEGMRVLLQDLWSAPDNCVTERQFLSRHFIDIDKKSLDVITDTLQTAGMIEVSLEGGITRYKMSEACKEKFKEKGL